MNEEGTGETETQRYARLGAQVAAEMTGNTPKRTTIRLVENGTRKTPVAETPESLAGYIARHLGGKLDVSTMHATFPSLSSAESAQRVLNLMGWSSVVVTEQA